MTDDSEENTMGYDPSEMCGATNGDDACVLKRHGRSDHVSASGDRW